MLSKKLSDYSAGDNLYHSLKSLCYLSLFLSLFQFDSGVDSFLHLSHQECYKREKGDIIITGKARVYSER